jgi:ribosomal protein S18 acetylase RimI-like enzyme
MGQMASPILTSARTGAGSWSGTVTAMLRTVLELARRLSDRDLRALAELERRTVAADGGRLKLEWGVLRVRAGEQVEDLLWWDSELLVGFLGLYAFGASTVELAGMVDPAARRRGIATALLEAALAICRERAYPRVLLVVPRGSAPGRALAISRGAALEHSEHALVLLDPPTAGATDPRVELRTATAADTPDLIRLLTAAFGGAQPGLPDWRLGDAARTLVVELEGSPVGTVRVARDGDTGGIYGFAIDPAWQGRGIGRDVLRRVCRQLRDDGVRRIGLEVEVDNDHALGLYTSLGFTQITTEDYYALTLCDAHRA